MRSIYFIGIGGIGMSALARYFNEQGVTVSGYDKTKTQLTKTLESEGMIIHYEEDLALIPKNPELVVYTPAIPEDHLELQFYKKNEVPLKKRAEVLGMISREKSCIAIAGTHGKTSTSAMLAHILKFGKLNMAAFVGGIMKNYDSNYLGGFADWIVLEADEFDRSFLQLSPKMSIILSMDPDHLDIYGTDDSIKETYRSFCRRTMNGGVLVYHHEVKDQLGEALLAELKYRNIRCVSFGKHKDAEWRMKGLKVEDGKWLFKAKIDKKKFRINWSMSGAHNAENATAAIGIASILINEEKEIEEALAGFKGIQRRFDIIYQDDQWVYIDDYAHHPTELKAAYNAARKMCPNKRLTAIFQPHLYSRTKDFYKGFAEALDQWDEIILLDIYPARESPMPGVSSQLIMDAMENPSRCIVADELLLHELKRKINEKEVIMTLGAGDIDLFVPQIKELLTNG